MKLEVLTEKEFKDFAYHQEQSSFLQTIGWGKQKGKNGWKYELLGIKKGKKVIAATMILSKMTPVKKKMFYAPHGFLLDYHNFELLDEFVSLVKEHVKQNQGFFFKIDPYVMLVERDIDGNIVENGINNKDVYDHLIKLGFKEVNGKRTQQSLQGKWIYWIDINGRNLEEVMKDMTSKTRQMIRKNEKNGVVVREGTYDELDKFKNIMDHTGERREFISRPLSYYQEMYKHLHEEDICKLYFAEINLKNQLEKFELEKKTLEQEYESKQKDFEAGKLKVNENKFKAKQKETQDAILRLDKSIAEYKELQKENGDVLLLGGIIYMIQDNAVLSFIGGAYSKYLEFQPFYSIHYELIKYAVEHHHRYYNFYGISGNLDEKDPMYGVYLFKKGFGGQVVELMGEFDYPVNKFYYYLYRMSYAVIHKLKKIKTKIHLF